MDDGDDTVFLSTFMVHLKPIVLIVPRITALRSGDQSESGSDQTDGQGQIQDNGVAFTNANAADISSAMSSLILLTMSSANLLRSSSVRGSSSEAGSSAGTPSD